MTPHGQSFLLPVTVTIPFSGDAEPSLRLMTTEPGEVWGEVPDAALSGKALVGEVSHFSYFLVVEP